MQEKNQIKILGICVNSSRKKYCQTRDQIRLHLHIYMYHENIIEAIPFYIIEYRKAPMI